MGSTPSPPSARRFSQPLGGLLPSAPCGLVPSRSHVQASPFRVFPSPGAAAARHRSLALLGLPQGCLLLRSDTARSSTSGPYSPGESVAKGPQLSEPPARYPLGLSPLQGLLRFGRRSRFRDPPLASFPPHTYGTWRRCSTGSPRAEGSAYLSRDVPALLRFLGLFDHSCVRARRGPGLSFRLGRDAASPRRLPHLLGPSSLPAGAA